MIILEYVLFYIVMVCFAYLVLAIILEVYRGYDEDLDDLMSDRSATMLALFTLSVFWIITVPYILIYSIIRGGSRNE